jgi:uncharacterized protein
MKLTQIHPETTGIDDQRAVVAFLADGASYGSPDMAIERVESHISIVFLVGDHAYKLKRAVRLSYLDYSQATQREKYCRAELALNRRTAPEIYQCVRAITREADGSLHFDGTGDAIDWVVQMRRFSQDDLFDRLADLGRLTPTMMRDLADRIAEFHKTTEAVTAYGGADGIREVIIGNAGNLVSACPPLDRVVVDHMNEAGLAQHAAIISLLEQRKIQGKVRRCHGDLHLRNICLIAQKPVIFDGIEFSEAFTCIDVLYDLAFLLMDLLHRRLHDFGNILFNRYLDRTGDIDGLAALPLFISVRAAIRAHVLVAQYQKTHQPSDIMNAQSYLRQAGKFLNLRRPCLIAIGGRSGAGKSTLALALAPAFMPVPGARIIRSDRIRKEMFGVSPETRLPMSAYKDTTNIQVYEKMRDEAARVVASGYTAIADATFLSESERDAISTAAQRAGVPFFGFWLDAAPDILRERLTARQGDISDANSKTLDLQEQVEIGSVHWRRIDANQSIRVQENIIREYAHI